MRHDREPDKSGEELYRRFLAGEESAFDQLVGLYRESLTQYINSFVNDMYEAEELMVVAFAELAADTKYKGQSSLKTYLFSIGKHLALRRVKNRRLGNHIPIEDIIYMLCGDEELPEVHYLSGERKERLLAAMGTLKSEYREVLHLLYFENMTYLEAGMAMGKSETQITNLAHRAKVSLKKRLGSEGADI